MTLRQLQGQSLLQQLTQEMANDTTYPSTTTAKVFQPRQGDGIYLNAWPYDNINCGITKECVYAFQRPMPGTRANAAAVHLLVRSTLSESSYQIATNPSANDALILITQKGAIMGL